MSDEIRIRILLALDAHAATGTNRYLGDDELAEAAGETVGAVRRQLEILESEEYVNLTKPLTGSWGARIKPKGTLLVERLREQASTPPKRTIGFHPEE